MSRTDEEWEAERQRAIKIRSLIRQAMDLLDDIPMPFTVDVELSSFSEKLLDAEGLANSLIGAFTRSYD